jgi:hypothetical protein
MQQRESSMRHAHVTKSLGNQYHPNKTKSRARRGGEESRINPKGSIPKPAYLTREVRVKAGDS